MTITWERDTQTWVAKSDDFDVMSCGKTPDHAAIALADCIRLYLNVHDRRGTDPHIRHFRGEHHDDDKAKE